MGWRESAVRCCYEELMDRYSCMLAGGREGLGFAVTDALIDGYLCMRG